WRRTASPLTSVDGNPVLIGASVLLTPSSAVAPRTPAPNMKRRLVSAVCDPSHTSGRILERSAAVAQRRCRVRRREGDSPWSRPEASPARDESNGNRGHHRDWPRRQVPFSRRSAWSSPQVPPSGANDWDCTPTPDKPRPVILVNGTFTTPALRYQAGAPLLKNAGYCVCAFSFGNASGVAQMPVQAIGDIHGSGRELAETVDRVVAATGAEEVDLVGHSQGAGALPDYYINELGGADKV